MKNKYIYPNGKELLTIINGKVCEGTIVSVRLWYNAEFQDSEAVSYKFKHKDEFYVLPITQEFFANDEDLKINHSIEPKESSDYTYRIAQGRYILKDGKAEYWHWNESIHSWDVESDSVKLVDGEIPDKLYNTIEDVYFFNDLVIHKDNGDIEIKRGLGKELELTEEQKAVLEKFKDVIKEVKEAGIQLVDDRENEAWHAINVSNFNVYFGYDEEHEVRFPAGSEIDIPWNYAYGEDRMTFIPKKKSNQ